MCGGVQGEGAIYAIDNHAEPALATLRYRLKSATIDAAEEPFQSGDHKFSRGTFLIRINNRSDLDAATKSLGLRAVALASAAHRENSSRPRPAHRLRSHLDQHARGRMVAARPRRTANSLRLHQHAGARENSGPQRQVRRDSISAGRLERQRDQDYRRPAHVLGQSTSVAEHAANAKSREK